MDACDPSNEVSLAEGKWDEAMDVLAASPVQVSPILIIIPYACFLAPLLALACARDEH